MSGKLQLTIQATHVTEFEKFLALWWEIFSHHQPDPQSYDMLTDSVGLAFKAHGPDFVLNCLLIWHSSNGGACCMARRPVATFLSAFQLTPVAKGAQAAICMKC